MVLCSYTINAILFLVYCKDSKNPVRNVNSINDGERAH